MAGSKSRLNAAQRQVAETFGRPIAAMAGAGSGKTFTMVQRILNAFDPQIVGDPELVVTSIEQVLAITFTKKAAGELKSRIRAGFKSIGRFDQALRVDAAWIDTIHGMCSRILRESALELELDPSFSVLEDDARTMLFEEVLEQVLLSEDPDTAADVERLLGEYRRSNLKRAITRLVEKASQSLRGFDSLESCPTEGETLEMPAACWEDFQEIVEPRVTKRQRKGALDIYWENLRALGGAAALWDPLVRVARQVGSAFWERKRALGALDNNDLLAKAVEALGRPEIEARYKDRFRLVINDEFQDTDCLQFQIIGKLAGEGLRRLCVVGDIKQSIYRFRGADLSLSEGFVEGLRREDARTGQRSVFDLATNYRSAGEILDFVNLVFNGGERAEDEPGLPFAYDDIGHGREEAEGDRSFADDAHGGPRVEVAELQYTHGRKSAAVNLAAAHVAKRFKGIHEGTGRPYGDMVVLLNTMSSAQTFADALDAEDIPNAITGGSVFSWHSVPNLLLDLVRLLANPLDGSAAAVTLSSGIFGFEPGDFRELVALAGIDVGGDRRLPIGRALARLLDPRGRSAEVAGTGRVGLAVSVLRRALALSGHAAPSAIIRNVLVDSGWLTRQAAADVAAPSRAVDEEEREAAGGAHGMAAVADALKLIRMVADLEADGCLGMRDLARRLERHLADLKEAPGFLATEDNDFVRIMTIHASKGLEFPVVAVAGLESGQERLFDGKCLLVSASTRIGGGGGAEPSYDLSTYGLPCLDRSLDGAEKREVDARHFATGPGGNVLRAIHAYGCEEQRRVRGVGASEGSPVSSDLFQLGALDPLVRKAREREDLCLWFGALTHYERDSEKAELMRKAYVAYTRAREALIVCLPVSVKIGDYRPRVNELKGIKNEKATISEIETLYSFFPDLRPLCENNEVAARIQRRRDAIATMGAYRLVPFSRVNVWRDQGVWPPELGGEPDDPEVGRPLVDEVPEADASRDVLEELPPIEIPVDFVDRPVTNYRYSPQWADGILSASSIKDKAERTIYLRHRPVDLSSEDDDDVEPPAYEKGSAFHEVCQLAVLDRRDGGPLVLPPEARIEAILRRHRLSDRQRTDVREALAAWFASDIAQGLMGYAHVEAEVPFFVPLDVAAPQVDTGCIRFNGFIDLLGHDGPQGRAPHIVDYKTGRAYRTRRERERAYGTQAMVYAYALMLQGFGAPRVTFVLVEQRDGDGLATCEFPSAGEVWTLERLRDELLGKIRSLVPQDDDR